MHTAGAEEVATGQAFHPYPPDGVAQDECVADDALDFNFARSAVS
jgi:hypothetical protein